MENTFTFEQLPQAVAMLTKEVSELKQLLLQKSDQQVVPPAERLLTVQQAADFLNLSVPTIYSKVSRGEHLYISTKWDTRKRTNAPNRFGIG